MKERLYIGDCLKVLPTLQENSVDTIITDPPYGLSNGNISQKIFDTFRGGFDFMLPNLNEANSKQIQYRDFVSVSVKGSNLGGLEVIPIIKPWVSVPKGSIDFDCNIEIGEEEINAGAIPTGLGVSDCVLMNKVDPGGCKFIGNFILDLGDTFDFPAGNVEGGDFLQLLSGGFAVPIGSIFNPGLPYPEADFPFFLRGFDVNNIVWGRNNTGDKPLSPSFVMTSAGAENQLMLRFELGGGLSNTFATITTSTRNAGDPGSGPKLIRTGAAASRLSTVFEPFRVCFIGGSTNGTNSIYFLHLFFPKGLINNIQKVFDNSGGFMGKDWDRGVPGVHFWEEALRVIKPGGYLLAFGGTRTHHRLMVAIEDAGFEIRDCMMWLYGSGFPKALDISKAIDKDAGEEREKVRVKYNGSELMRHGGENTRPWMEEAIKNGYHELAGGTPVTEAAQLWDGWKTALKPAWEPIIVAMKPLDGTFAQNALRHGVAGLNIDGGRIGTEERFNTSESKNNIYGQFAGSENSGRPTQGRYPSNVLLDEDAARLLDEQSGELTSGDAPAGFSGEFKEKNVFGRYAKNQIRKETVYADTGGASRFFYTGKASPAERGDYNTHPTVKPVDLMQYLVKLTATPTGGTVLDMFAGSGSTGLACQNEGRDYILIELDETHGKIIERRLRENYGMFCNLEVIRK